MLTTLRKIVQEVDGAKDLRQALKLIVSKVCAAINTEAVSIFLIDSRKSEYVLMATEGLSQSLAENLRVPLDEGLIGLVGRREEPINLEDAPSHQNYYYDEALGKEKFSAFLGVPIIHHRRLYGVLAVQQVEKRCFDEDDEAFLVTLATQLASVIERAETSGELASLKPFRPKVRSSKDNLIHGVPSVAGIAIGTAVIVYPQADLDAVPDRKISDVDAEIAEITSALEHTRQDIQKLSERMQTTLPKNEQALFDVYLCLLADDSLGEEIIAEIHQGAWAQAALRIVIKRHIRQFESMQDQYLAERASDFRDLGRRILAYLQLGSQKVIEYPEDTILVGEEISASALAQVPQGSLAGIVSARGSSYSHVAILARALGIPTVMGAKGLAVKNIGGQRIVVDGYFGQVYISPSRRLLNDFKKLAAEERELDESLEALRKEEAVTPDGHRVRLLVNTGLEGEAGLSLSVGAEGVGLFRTEMQFMTRDSFPVEEEQRVIYRQLLQAFAPRPVTMRTLDIGGDKELPYFPVHDTNPFLGWRGIRITLDHPELFLIQIRAMLRASLDLNNLQILLPMISGVGELDEALNLINQAYEELIEEELAIQRPKIGVMIEVPSAVYQTRTLAKRVDFVSVGSNDLTQYILAVDRNNARVAGLYDSLHPAVLQALVQVVEGAHAEGVSASICGEMSSDPVAVTLLLAMGFDSISVNSTSLPRTKWIIRNFSLAQARKLLSEVLVMDNAPLIRFHLEKALDDAGLGGLIRAGKR
jgi:phosphotransferase system, enzyme I, PtsP